MIFTITGRPRNGKSLYAVDYIEKKAKAENRPVYYSRIKGIKFENWFELVDAKKWQECPEGAIILFDEAHYDFPNRASTSNTPSHVLAFNVHGHYGYDLYFITQAPKFIDPNIRGLTQEHHHVVRHFGKEKATIHRWDVIKDNPDTKSAKEESIKTSFTYPKHRFGQYDSSVQHNVKVNVPFKYKLLYLIPIIVLALIAKVSYSWYHQLNDPKTIEPVNTPIIHDKNNIIQAAEPIQQNQQLSYIQAHLPEIPDIAESAPIYQANHQPTQIPRPQACIASKKTCKCFTQQATPYQASDEFCRSVVKNGYFIDDLPIAQNQLQPLQPSPQEFKPI